MCVWSEVTLTKTCKSTSYKVSEHAEPKSNRFPSLKKIPSKDLCAIFWLLCSEVKWHQERVRLFSCESVRCLHKAKRGWKGEERRERHKNKSFLRTWEDLHPPDTRWCNKSPTHNTIQFLTNPQQQTNKPTNNQPPSPPLPTTHTMPGNLFVWLFIACCVCVVLPSA